MLSNDEIKARFFTPNKRIDRYGNFIPTPAIDSYGTLLHYHLLEGMTDAIALKKLKGYGMNDVAARFALKTAKTFVTEVLELPLDEIRDAANSTERQMWMDFNTALARVGDVYNAAMDEPIEFEGYVYQADARSRAAMHERINLSRAETINWLDINNKEVEFDVTKLTNLLSSIVTRNDWLKAELTQVKSELRRAGEAKDYDTIKRLLVSELKPTPVGAVEK